MNAIEYEVLVRVDACCRTPVLVKNGESVPARNGTRYSLYGRTDDQVKALRMLEAARHVRLEP